MHVTRVHGSQCSGLYTDRPHGYTHSDADGCSDRMIMTLTFREDNDLMRRHCEIHGIHAANNTATGLL